MRYRPDVDGLRAIAVIPVVLFHAGAWFCRGGYVGVDVFFVISGYLITSIIVSEIDAGVFSLASFYQRRVRRIFPALIVVLVFCLIAGAAISTPSDFEQLGRATVAAVLFASNIFYWKQANYFDVGAAEKPLLHTWSLAVEEQYYLIYPLLLIALAKFAPRWRNATIIAGAAVSFGFCAVLIYSRPTATFYLLPTRAWELLAGGLIAVKALPVSRNRVVNGMAGLVGLACILTPVFCYDPLMRFPGVSALPPVVGAVLIIWSGAGLAGPVYALLASPPMTTIGKASYSLYLWHYPFIVFANGVTLHGLGARASVAVCLAAFAASLVSLRFVEKPFRFAAPAAIPRVVVLASLGMALLLASGAAISAMRGLPGRMTATAARFLAVEQEQYGVHHWECMSLEGRIVHPSDACKLGAEGAEATALLWGDSHAVVTATALESSARRNNAAFLFAASVDCPIGLGVSIDAHTGPAFVATPAYQFCGQYQKEMAALALSKPEIRDVVLASRWTNWRIGEPGSPVETPVDIRLADAAGVAKSTTDNRKIFARGFETLVKTLVAAGKTVWIIGPLPEPATRVPKALYVRELGFDTSNIDIPEAAYRSRHRYILSFFDEIAKAYPVRFLWPAENLCAKGLCPAAENGEPLFFDQDHLSAFGAGKTSRLYDPIWSRAERAPPETRK